MNCGSQPSSVRASGRGHHPCVVHEDVERPAPAPDEPVDRWRVGEFELRDAHARISCAGRDLRCDVCAGLRVAYRQRYVGSRTSQRACRLDADADAAPVTIARLPARSTSARTSAAVE